MSATHTSVTAAAPATPRRDPAARVFSTSIVISGIRCLLTYVVFPWALPLLHVAGDVGPVVGVVVGTVAIWFNVASIRRFWQASHPWRWAVTILNTGVIGLLLALLMIDGGDLLT